MTYYNDFDRVNCHWLRALASAGLIGSGAVDDRGIQEIRPDDIRGFQRVHLFAGIGGWDYALRLAGWPDDWPVWTGSCPCQPFSCAGKGEAQKDERHLWPEMFRLIRECRPPIVFGEQVASAIRFGWLDGICADLEGEGYAVGASVLGAHSVGAPHKRQRLYWAAIASDFRPVSDAERERTRIGVAGIKGCSRIGRDRPAIDSGACGLVLADRPRLEGHAGDGDALGEPRRHDSDARGSVAATGGAGLLSEIERERELYESEWRECLSRVGRRAGGLPNANALARREGIAGIESRNCSRGAWDGARSVPDAESGRRGELRGAAIAPDGRHVDGGSPWDNFEIIWCRDPRGEEFPLIPRRIEPGLAPLVNGLPGRMAQLRGLGNSIVPQVAAAFVQEVMGEWV